jgi:hypothetical protein
MVIDSATLPPQLRKLDLPRYLSRRDVPPEPPERQCQGALALRVMSKIANFSPHAFI